LRIAVDFEPISFISLLNENPVGSQVIRASCLVALGSGSLKPWRHHQHRPMRRSCTWRCRRGWGEAKEACDRLWKIWNDWIISDLGPSLAIIKYHQL